MESKRHEKLFNHYTNVFHQKPVFEMQLKPECGLYGIRTLVYKPTKSNNFWKLWTIGASDYRMPEREIGLGRKANRRNEYMMFLAPDVKVKRSSKQWFYLNSLLWATAEYACNAGENLTVSDSLDMGINGKYCGTVLLLPEILTPDSVKCYISSKSFISIFQVMPITKQQLCEKLKRGYEGIYWLMEQFYTHDDDYRLISSKPFTTP